MIVNTSFSMVVAIAGFKLPAKNGTIIESNELIDFYKSSKENQIFYEYVDRLVSHMYSLFQIGLK
jgi:nucleoside diphosphate kinase